MKVYPQTDKGNIMNGYVYSTLASDIRIVHWIPTANETPVEGPAVLIKGGAGITNKNFITPMGVVTPVTSEQIELLNSHPTFKAYLKSGHLRIEKRKEDVDKVVADMNRLDPSAPLTYADVPKEMNVSTKQ